MSAKFVGHDESVHPQSAAVLVEDTVICSGARALDPRTSRLAQGDLNARALQCLRNLDAVLGRAAGQFGVPLPRTVALKVYLRNLRDTPLLLEALGEHFQGKPLPALTLLEVNRLEEDHDVEIDCVAVTGHSTVEVLDAEAKRPFAGLVRAGDHWFCSALTPEAAALHYEPHEFLSEVDSVLDRMGNRLEACGASLQDVFTTRVYVTNMKDRHLVNQAYSRHFRQNPLRVITEVGRLPGNQRVAIEAEAHTGKDREYLSTTKGQIPTGPFTQGIRIGRKVYCSGVRPIDPATGRLVKGAFRDRAVRCMENLNAILEAGGAAMDQTFETRLYLRNLADLPAVDEVFRSYFRSGAYPVRTAIEIGRLNEDYEKGWEPNHDIEVQCSAHLDL